MKLNILNIRLGSYYLVISFNAISSSSSSSSSCHRRSKKIK